MNTSEAYAALEKAATTPRAHAALKTLHSEMSGEGAGGKRGEQGEESPGQKAARAGGGSQPFGTDPRKQAAARFGK